MHNQKEKLVFALLILVAVPFAQCTEYLVKWRNETAQNNMRLPLQTLEILSVKSLLTKIEIPEEKRSAALATLRSRADIEYVVRNQEIHGSHIKISSASPLPEQWALEKIKAAAAWDLAGSRGSRTVVLAVLDTGVDYNHEALSLNTISGYDFKDNDADPKDETSFLNPGHGTHCAGIAGGNGVGAIGISPMLSILPLRVLGKDASGNIDDAIQAIDYAIEKNVSVISASWGGEMTAVEAQPLVEAIKRAGAAGILFVTAAGNGDEQGIGMDIDGMNIYPAVVQLANTLTVAASDEWDRAASFSNYGKSKVDIAAPGVNILSTLPRNRYDTLSGTSMATPLVAGLAAYLKSLDSTLGPSEIKKILLQSGTPVDIKTNCNCRIDALSAVTTVLKGIF